MSDLDGRMKMYEGMTARQMCMPRLPILARIDGKNFHGWTHDLVEPFDSKLRECMENTTMDLVKESCANCGYTQSDEITLAFYAKERKTQLFLGGRIQRMVSVLASMATYWFNKHVEALLPKKAETPAFFDCRVWQVPNLDEVANVFVWREQDAVRNSVSMAARSYYSHKQLFGKDSNEQQEMLWQKGRNWNDYPTAHKRGVYIQRRKSMRFLTESERMAIPQNHRPEKDLEVERSQIVRINLPRLTTIENRVEVLLFGEEPKLK